jgi:aspartyl-tRNA synthetase
MINELASHMGEEVKVNGFVRTIRSQKKMVFLVIYDITGAVQVAHQKGGDAIAEMLEVVTQESAVTIYGQVVEAPNVKLGGIEVVPDKIVIENLADSPLPIDDNSSLETRIDSRHLSLRRDQDTLIMKISTVIEEAAREYWRKNDFIEIHSPKFISTASESGAELFSVPYFEKTAYLAQSPQFYKQMAMAGGLDRVFEVGPVFRANPSFTSRHDTEFTMYDMEVAWIDSYEDVMRIEEELLQCVLWAIERKFHYEIEEMFGVEVVVPTLPFPRITLKEARGWLAEVGHAIDHKADLDPEGERLLSKIVLEKFGHEFVFVTEYPADVRAFYHMRFPGTDTTMSYDLIYKGVEITTGAQREHRLDQLMKQASEKGYNLEPLSGYFGFFKHGCPPHGGCGIGLTRILMQMLGVKNVREVTFLYRGPNRLTP